MSAIGSMINKTVMGVIAAVIFILFWFYPSKSKYTEIIMLWLL